MDLLNPWSVNASLRAGVSCLFLLVLAVTGNAVESRNFSGLSLADAIERVQTSSNVEIVYSTTLVRHNDYVDVEPTRSDPLDALREMLEPHGLHLKSDEDTYYVVRAPQARDARGLSGTLVVIVRDEYNQNRLPDAQVSISHLDAKIEKLGDGAFQVSKLDPGRYIVSATAPDYQLQHQSVNLSQGKVSVVPMEIVPLDQTKLEDIVVSTSRYELIRDPGTSIASFDLEALQSLPNLGGDPLRVTQRLPGAASGGLSAKVHIRGGEENETLLVLDGLELTDPFHLRDYQSVFSAIDQRILAGVDVYTGGFPASFGDKLSSVISMRSFEPLDLQHELSFSFFNTTLLSSGIFAGADGEWIVSARRGNLDLVLDVVDDSLGEPDYADAFAHVEYRFGEKTTVSLNAFAADDEVLVITEPLPQEREQAQSDTRNLHVWTTVANEWSNDLFSQTLISNTRIRNFRRGFLRDEEGTVGNVADHRNLDEFAIKQDWNWRLATKHQTQWGFQWKSIQADYDYASNAEFFDLLADLDTLPDSIIRSSRFSLSGTDLGVYVSNRWIPSDKWAAELGLRWDKKSYTPDGGQLSPRLNVLYRLDQKNEFRLSIGRFHQSQRLHELQIEDGVEVFFPAQRADHYILGFEHRFSKSLRLRVEAYTKRFADLRPRYENLFDPLVLLPELTSDRVRIAPSKSGARGLEVYLSKEPNEPLSWWAGYAYSKVEDDFSGVKIPRSWDQRHAVSGGVSYRTDEWDLSLGASLRSGWPTTSLSLATETTPNGDLTVTPVLGRRNAERLGSFTSVDIHLARNFSLTNGSRLSLFFDVINLFDSKNECCVEYDATQLNDGNVSLKKEVEHWLPIVPSFGVRWEF